MPIYAYRCAACGHARDVLQKVAEAPLTVCPVCGAAEFVKQLTAAGFQLKGSGWYATDFKGGGKAADKSADKAGGAGADKAGDAGSGKTEPAAPAGTGDGKSVASSGGCGASCACH